ncbi:Activator of Hsp90 ATPase [Aphelenchoides bicaudatus]|nr:Activator of Hsp90 ATPase [Aphelenchoides bicaudatus]
MADSANVNNWHWVEKNAEPWSREILKELLLGQNIEQGPVKILLKDFKKLEGDATANNRKAKLIFLYDWSIEVNFVGNVTGSDLEYKGVIEIPNLSDEFDASEIDMNTTIESKGPQEAQIRHVLSTAGLEFIRKQLGEYIRRLKEEFSKGLILETTKPQVVIKGGKGNVFDKRSFQNEVVTSSTKEEKLEKVDVTSFELSDAFKAPPSRLYEMLTSQDLVKVWAGASATVDSKVGGQFSLFGGMITGSFVSLKEDEIVCKWRLKDYPTNHFAQLTVSFVDKGDSSEMKLQVNDCPSNLSEKTQEGLNRHYLQNIGRTFSISSRIF